jgi:hypothetical protein
MLLGAAPASSQTAGIAGDGPTSTAGIGLAQDAWTASHGPGDYAQNYAVFENGRYFLQFRDGVTSYIEYGWDKPGVRLADAQDSARGFLPSDARLVESYDLPATSGGPLSMFVERYDSPALAALPAAWGGTPWGGILVTYFQTPAPDSIEPNVDRVAIAAGVAA